MTDDLITKIMEQCTACLEAYRSELAAADAEIARLRRDKAELVDALTKISHDGYTDADERILSSEPIMIWQAVARVALRSCIEKDGPS